MFEPESPTRKGNAQKINIMANRRLDGKCRTCATPWKDTDFRKTIPNQAMTPQEIQKLADRGIPVSGQNLNAVYDSATAGWKLDPIFERGADICQLWETEKAAQRRVLAAKKRDAMRFR